MSTIFKDIPCPNDCKYKFIPWNQCTYPIKDDIPLYPIDTCPYYRKANKRQCSICGWEGLENETGFGHKDFYCPICKQESLL